MYYYLLMLLSFALAGLQDLKERKVSDYLWLPAVLGIVILYYIEFQYLETFLLRLVIVGVAGVLATRRGILGQADIIAFTLLVSDPYNLQYPVLLVVALGTIFFVHFTWFFVINFRPGSALGRSLFSRLPKRRRINSVSLPEFRAQAKWLPVSVTLLDGTTATIPHNVNSARDAVESMGDDVKEVNVVYGWPIVTILAEGFFVYFLLLAIFHFPLLLQTP